MSKMRFIRICALAAPAIVGLSAAAPAHAFTYGTAYMTSWSGCDSSCSSAPSLSYTDDQILMFEGAMNAYGHTHTHRYVNQSVWASDLVEDENFGGHDNLYSDDGDVYAYSGHGSADAEGKTFQIPMCKKGSTDSCWYNAEDSRFGERDTVYADVSPGKMRFMIYGTCFSVDKAPNYQWGQAFWYGTDVVMGYRGVSADSETTDEVMEDLVGEALGGAGDFKPSWFWAAEDWWVDDTASIMASGTDSTHAATRRDNLDRTWGRRAATPHHDTFAWAWHEG